jgi:hypothetical protein
MKECYLLERCGFFNKYSAHPEVNCQEFIDQYCKGEKMNECKRLQYRNQYGVAPSDDMMPNGLMI